MSKQKKESANSKIGHINYQVGGMERKQIDQKRTETKGSVGHHQETNICTVRSQKENWEKDRENIWRNNGWKLAKFDERQEYKCWSLTNSEWDKLKRPIGILYNQTFKSQKTFFFFKVKRILKAAREKTHQLYTNTLDNLDEMDKFLETKLNHKEIQTLNRPITGKENSNQKSPNEEKSWILDLPWWILLNN